MTVREAKPADSAAIAAIYNGGIIERRSTFETEFRSTSDLAEWFRSLRYPAMIGEAAR